MNDDDGVVVGGIFKRLVGGTTGSTAADVAAGVLSTESPSKNLDMAI
jgi:hypothetical protein